VNSICPCRKISTAPEKGATGKQGKMQMAELAGGLQDNGFQEWQQATMFWARRSRSQARRRADQCGWAEA
jgi:hypothetical protein